MTDETQDTTTEEVAETGSETTGKTYTEAELQAIVKDRVGREKKSFATLQAELETVKTANSDELAKYKKLVDSQLTEAKKSLPDAVKALLDKLDPMEQLEWLSNPDNVKPIERKKIPETPPADDGAPQGEQNIKLPFGLGRR